MLKTETVSGINEESVLDAFRDRGIIVSDIVAIKRASSNNMGLYSVTYNDRENEPYDISNISEEEDDDYNDNEFEHKRIKRLRYKYGMYSDYKGD